MTDGLAPWKLSVPGTGEGVSGFYYIPEFVSAHEESFLLDKIDAPHARWKQ